MEAALTRGLRRGPRRDRAAASTSSSSPTARSAPSASPIPSLLAVAAVHHHLVREGTRLQAGLVIETGEARQVHHIATLIGYGASVVNPWVMFETVGEEVEQGCLRRRRRQRLDREEAELAVRKAIGKGLLKTISKMGISTIQSYCGAQIFEAVGLSRELVDRHFTGTASRIGGVGLDVLATEALARHAPRLPARRGRPAARRRHLRLASRRRAPHVEPGHDRAAPARGAQRRRGRPTRSSRASPTRTRRAARRCAGCWQIRADQTPIAIEEVEPWTQIVKRFVTGAMSLGSLGREAHENLATRDERASAASRTPGEGGEDPERFHDDRRSAIKQVASGPLRRHDRLPRQRRRAADQDGAGREAGRGRAAARAQGRRVHRPDPPLDAGRRPDLAAAPPRHLLDRGPQAADLRPALREPDGAHLGQARRRGRASAPSPPASRRPTATTC